MLTRNEFKKMVRTAALKVNKGWELKNKDIEFSDKVLEIINKSEKGISDVKKRLPKLISCAIATKRYYWAKMHYTAGPFEDKFDLSTDAFKKTDYYPKKKIWVEIDDDTVIEVCGGHPYSEGPWKSGALVGYEGFDW